MNKSALILFVHFNRASYFTLNRNIRKFEKFAGHRSSFSKLSGSQVTEDDRFQLWFQPVKRSLNSAGVKMKSFRYAYRRCEGPQLWRKRFTSLRASKKQKQNATKKVSTGTTNLLMLFLSSNLNVVFSLSIKTIFDNNFTDWQFFRVIQVGNGWEVPSNLLFCNIFKLVFVLILSYKSYKWNKMSCFKTSSETKVIA